MLRKLARTVLAVLVSTGTASAACLSIDREFWVNYCNVGIDVVWNDQGYCASNNRAQYPCSDYIGPGGRSTAGFTGYVNWRECQSNGIGDVLAVEDGYGNVVCKG